MMRVDARRRPYRRGWFESVLTLDRNYGKIFTKSDNSANWRPVSITRPSYMYSTPQKMSS